MANLAGIDSFLSGRRLALVGVSTRAGDLSRIILRELTAHGYDMVPIRPGAAEIDGKPAFARMKDVPGHLDGAILMTPPAVTAAVVRECPDAGVTRVWMHRGVGHGAVSDEAVAFCEAHGIEVVAGECPLMFVDGTGVHGTHAALRKLIGTYPDAVPRDAAPAPGRRALVFVLHAAIGWLACAATMALLLAAVPLGAALWLHALAAPLIFAAVATSYFRRRAPVPPLAAAGAFAGSIALLDAVVVGPAILARFVGLWLPLALIVAVTLGAGLFAQRLRHGERRTHGLRIRS